MTVQPETDEPTPTAGPAAASNAHATPSGQAGDEPHGVASGETPGSTQTPTTEALLAELAATKDQLLRTLAELQNVQRRHATELANARDYGIRDFAFALLGVKDTLEHVVRDDRGTLEQVKMGAEMTLRNLAAAFERYKIAEISSDGARFDPNLHQAMTQIESEQPAGTVLSTFQKGYMIGERCLRPAMVAVAKQRAEPTAPSGNGTLEAGATGAN
jgi:molecular chaperone GrpE